MNPSIVLPGLVLAAVVFVMVPVGVAVFSWYRRPKSLRCPVTGRDARVAFDAPRAALAAAVGGHSLRIRGCSLWDDHYGCGQDCRRLPEDAMREVHDQVA